VVKERMDLLELLRKGGMDGDLDFLREALRVLVEGIMDAEVSARTGAGYRERSTERVTQRNGYRSRQWDTRVGTMDLRIPRLRVGSYFPSLLEPRCRSEKALLAVIQQAYKVVEQLSERFPHAASMLDEAGADILAFTHFPMEHWKKIWSNNPQ